MSRPEPAPRTSPPEFFRLAGNPVRWRLITELARSDLQVHELTEMLGRPQNLVSYHLARLRTAGLVSARRSSADGRDAYYALSLPRLGELIATAGRAAHPGLRLGPAGPTARPRSPGQAGARLLFLCTGNSARSQLAEALATALSGGQVTARSAGSHPKPLHVNALRVLAERGLDVSAHRPKPLSLFGADEFDYVITLCDRVREVCPEFPGHPGYIHWSIPDPAASGSDDAATYPAFAATADEVETRLMYLLAGLGALAGPVRTRTRMTGR